MAARRRVRHGSVRYDMVENRFLARRRLRRYAGFWSLWALGVGAVISGDFFGWNFGLAVAGLGGLAIAAAVVAVMYLCLSFSLAEMSPAMPYAGGAYSFARTALGPWGGFVTGMAELVEYVLTPAVIVVGIGGYMGAVVNSLLGMDVPAPLWWLLFYVIFVGINVSGVTATFQVAIFLTLLALSFLAVFWIGAAFHFSLDAALNIEAQAGNSRWLPMGWLGAAQALPFAVWFYLAIEQVPLAAEESRRPTQEIPKALIWGIVTLIGASALTLVLNSGVGKGAAAVGESNEPILLAFDAIFGVGQGAWALALIAVAGLAASFHALIYAYGRRIFSLSRSGYLPRWLSLTDAYTMTPHWALLAGAVAGYLVALGIEFGEGWLGSEVPVAAVLLNMAVFGAVIAYIMQMLSFICLRQKYPGLYRPYRSPLGIAGAVVAGLIAGVTLILLFFNVDYRAGLFGCGAFFAVALLYYAFFARNRLVVSVEENFALQLEEEGSAWERMSEPEEDGDW